MRRMTSLLTFLIPLQTILPLPTVTLHLIRRSVKIPTKVNTVEHTLQILILQKLFHFPNSPFPHVHFVPINCWSNPHSFHILLYIFKWKNLAVFKANIYFLRNQASDTYMKRSMPLGVFLHVGGFWQMKMSCFFFLSIPM